MRSGGAGLRKAGQLLQPLLFQPSCLVYHHWGLPPRRTELGGRAVPAIAGRYQRLHLRVHRFGERAAVVNLAPSEAKTCQGNLARALAEEDARLSLIHI